LGSLRDIRLIRNSKTTASIDFYDYLLSGKKMNDLRLQLDDTIFIPPRGKTVTINGEINRPAIYELKDKEGLLDLVSIAGDFTTKAHLDRIQIDRIVPAEQRKTLGMERMVIDVNMNHLQAVGTHLELLDGDTIIVFPVQDLRENYVDISGNVSRPGRYEIKEKLKVNDLVELADGIISDTYLEMAHLVRFNNDLTREMFELHLGQALQKNEQDNMVLQPHDSLIIFNKNNILNAFKSVNILGAVKSPGEYIFYDRMTINELLVQAGGFAKNVYKVKLEVMRVDPQTTSLNKFGNSLEMQDFVTIEEFGQISQNEKFNTLQPHDIVFVRADPNFKLNQLVSVTGAVTFPGEYALLSPKEHVSDLIERAGGITQDAYPEASALIRDSIEVNIDLFNIMENPGSNIDFNVLSGDEIHIYKHPNMVFIYGEVNNPGAYKYIPGRSVSKYINEAGGYSSKADRRDVSIRYPNGEGGEIKRFWFSPPVMDGSIISVATETREEIDKTEMAKEITAILANLAQV
jgi:protein involved in polysaccharide export with SLBB domain